jgi:hypothetical protein
MLKKTNMNKDAEARQAFLLVKKDCFKTNNIDRECLINILVRKGFKIVDFEILISNFIIRH